MMAEQSKPHPKFQSRPADLPDFERPPLIEVVLGIQFSALRAYRSVHAGLLWDSRFRKEFPKCEERIPIDPVFETFGPPKAAQRRLRVEEMTAPIIPRLWFINDDETELVQIQSDRFLHNWRRIEGNNEYPRYEAIRERFFAELNEVQEFFKVQGIGNVEPNQCEVTYVNHIELPTGEDPRAQLHSIFSTYHPPLEQKRTLGARLPPLEDARFTMRYVIADMTSTEPRGRLHVKVEPALKDNKPVIRLDLTARGIPKPSSLDGVAEFFDLGRETIVRGFATLTTEEMHKHWGRIR